MFQFIKKITLITKEDSKRNQHNFERDFLTTVPNVEAAGQPVDIGIISPSAHVDEEVRRVFNSEAKGESVHTYICISEMEG